MKFGAYFVKFELNLSHLFSLNLKAQNLRRRLRSADLNSAPSPRPASANLAFRGFYRFSGFAAVVPAVSARLLQIVFCASYVFFAKHCVVVKYA